MGYGSSDEHRQSWRSRPASEKLLLKMEPFCLDVEQGVCFSLNPVGLKIWELLKKGCSLEQIADALGQEFPVSRPQLVSDAREFIAALEAKQLIRRPNQTTPKRSGFFENLLRRKRRLSAQ